MTRHRMLLADDHTVVLEGLRRILDRPEFEIVGTAVNGLALVQAVADLRPEVVIADISLPSLSGIEAARRIRDQNEHVKIIFLTMHPDVSYAVEALVAGGSGYVLKNSAGEELLTAIQEVLQGRVYVAESIRDVVMQALDAGPKKGRRSTDLLTPRQRQVLRLLAEGRQVKEIAAILNVSPKTVEFHKQQMKEMLGAHTVAELALYAARHGIVA